MYCSLLILCICLFMYGYVFTIRCYRTNHVYLLLCNVLNTVELWKYYVKFFKRNKPEYHNRSFCFSFFKKQNSTKSHELLAISRRQRRPHTLDDVLFSRPFGCFHLQHLPIRLLVTKKQLISCLYFKSRSS